MLASTWLSSPAGALFRSSINYVALLDTPFSPFRLSQAFQLWVYFAYAALFGLAMFWHGQVTRTLRKPYLDEVFHIPQAQAYCHGRYDVWDPKLTTPPGLYILTAVSARLFGSGCSNSTLRSFNVAALFMVFAYASDCRALISRTRNRIPTSEVTSIASRIQAWTSGLKTLSPDDVHTGLNIALFPILFFFSGLYYTDVLSTCVVLRAYRLFLEREGGHKDTGEGLVWLYVTGIAALWMRQTNIFWVAIFLAGLEVVRTLEYSRTSQSAQEARPHALKDMVSFHVRQCSQGNIHDVPLETAGVHDFVLCAISIAIAAASHPVLILSRLWPYIGLLISFAGFVFWNGGVVLGDKSNHVATIHLPQLLYIWPFITFFSAPLIIPVAVKYVFGLQKLFSIPLFPRLRWQYLLAAAYCAIALVATLAVIRFNTTIHPFTLADNRHYMFYVFRYTILRHPMIRYLLAPVYLVCGYFVYLTLCSQQPITLTMFNGKTSSKDSNLDSDTDTKPTELSEGPKTSFVIILLATTALSLITAPLVEPRYFILPWVMWRLNVPTLPVATLPLKAKRNEYLEMSQKIIHWSKFWGWQGHDYRLWFETAWLLLINLVTGYVFLNQGFEWKQEPGNVQRFMW